MTSDQGGKTPPGQPAMCWDLPASTASEGSSLVSARAEQVSEHAGNVWERSPFSASFTSGLDLAVQAQAVMPGEQSMLLLLGQ